MEVIPFRTPGLGDQTYLFTHEGKGILVDPQRDIDRFLDAAAEQDVELRFVLETHLHNDYVSGAREAARRTGAELVLPAAAAPAYWHTPAFHLEDITAGGLTIRPIHTPGHTPEHTSYLLLVDDAPVAVFTGGSLLASAAGRPDLLGTARARTLARLQYGSLRRLATLPPKVALYPTHGAGSFCTTGDAGRHTSTVGAELADNPMLAIADAEHFADEVLADPAPIPAFYRHMGPANLRGGPPMPGLRVPELAVADIPGDARVIDVRPRRAQAAGLLPGSVGIELDEDFGVWAGWLLPYRTPLVLVAEPGQDVSEAVVQLARIGVDTVRGVVRDLGRAGTQTFTLVGLRDFLALLDRPDAQLLDVRTPAEVRQAAVPGAVRRFLPDLVSEGVPAELDRDRPVLVACASGHRSAIAATLLLEAGFRPVVLTGAGIPEVVKARAARHAA